MRLAAAEALLEECHYQPERLPEAMEEAGRLLNYDFFCLVSADLARPDLILIDGGLGQLSAALEGLKQVGQDQIPIMGLAKARGEKEERIFLPGRKNPIVLRPTSPATHLVQRIRDEAHRFALTYHRNLRGKALLSSELDQIAGIGTIRRKRLLKQFGSLQRVAAATDDELRSAGLDVSTVAALRKALTPS